MIDDTEDVLATPSCGQLVELDCEGLYARAWRCDAIHVPEVILDKGGFILEAKEFTVSESAERAT